ncbi:hypothetical protein RFI_18793 [Reticulomyxa filosa]|uniref:Trafficking protein particle complex subunit n=1 Tax=Reticulomyxa filosa TaxID=46433 RepID=X6MWU7_RETFI|nr:hypothetical protein RFI_18793 [Reticulomyxa filosa]|eukprot:ETO18473.1 hypothetical protein RFI_18793 [Reticulomyxa filosa]
MIYGFYLFERKGNCIYFKEFVKFSRNLKTKNEKEYQKFLFGIVRTLKSFCHFVSHTPKDNIIRVVTTQSFKLHVMLTPTGLTFCILSNIDTHSVQQTLHFLYDQYITYVSKNPLQNAGEPIESQLFDAKTRPNKAIQQSNKQTKQKKMTYTIVLFEKDELNFEDDNKKKIKKKQDFTTPKFHPNQKSRNEPTKSTK